MVSTTVYLPLENAERLRVVSGRTGVPQAEIIRRGVAQQLAVEERRLAAEEREPTEEGDEVPRG